jgi:two-component system sensor histidine kinase YesM
MMDSVDSVRIYADIPGLYLGGIFRRIEELSMPDQWTEGFHFGQNYWSLRENEGLSFFTALTDMNYSGIGVLKINVKTLVLDRFLSQMQLTNDTISAIVMPDKTIYSNGKSPIPSFFSALPESEGFKLINNHIENWVYIKRLNAWAVSICSNQSLMEGVYPTLIGTFVIMLGLLILLSLIYLFLIQSVMKRIKQLARHFRNNEEGHFLVYPGKAGKDEIGELIVTFNEMANQTDVLINTVQKEEIHRRDAEYDALQAKIEPHFLYGTLESIRMLAEERGAGDVADIIFNFARLMRYSLHDGTRGQLATFGEEIDNVRLFLQLQKFRYGDRLDFCVNIPNELHLWKCPRFLLQPLVENCISHGLGNRRGVVNITVNMELHDDTVILNIIDDGAGMTQERFNQIEAMLQDGNNTDVITNEGGFALNNVNTRMRSYFGSGSTLSIKARDGGGVCCRMTLPYPTI